MLTLINIWMRKPWKTYQFPVRDIAALIEISQDESKFVKIRSLTFEWVKYYNNTGTIFLLLDQTPTTTSSPTQLHKATPQNLICCSEIKKGASSK